MAAAAKALLVPVSGSGCTRTKVSEVSSVDMTTISYDLNRIVAQVHDHM